MDLRPSGTRQKGGTWQTPPAETGFLAGESKIHLVLKLKVRDGSVESSGWMEGPCILGAPLKAGGRELMPPWGPGTVLRPCYWG